MKINTTSILCLIVRIYRFYCARPKCYSCIRKPHLLSIPATPGCFL